MRARGFSLAFLLSAVLFVVSAANAGAATVGSWTKTCVAPNWMTGVLEAVPDVNVSDPTSGFWGFTSKQPGGHWLTQYNLARISTPLSTPTVLIFLFYHECAHAQFNSSDEGVADCQGLAAMSHDMPVTPSMIAEIRAVYNSLGRPFPSGPC